MVVEREAEGEPEGAGEEGTGLALGLVPEARVETKVWVWPAWTMVLVLV